MRPGPDVPRQQCMSHAQERRLRRHRSATATMTLAKRSDVSRLISRFNRLNPHAGKSTEMKAQFITIRCAGRRARRSRSCAIPASTYGSTNISRTRLPATNLVRLYDRAGITPREGLRAKEPLAEELGLTRPEVTDDEVLDAMIEHPILIKRPLVETDKGVRLCRPQDVVREISDKPRRDDEPASTRACCSRAMPAAFSRWPTAATPTSCSGSSRATARSSRSTASSVALAAADASARTGSR